MAQSIKSRQFGSFLKYTHDLQEVNLFQLFPKNNTNKAKYVALTHAKSRIAMVASIARKTYIPANNRQPAFDPEEVSLILNDFYKFFGIVQGQNKKLHIYTDIKPNDKWPGISQFCHYLITSRDSIKYVANSPVKKIKKQYTNPLSVDTIEQICATFGIIASHYQNQSTTCSDEQAKKVLNDIFGYY